MLIALLALSACDTDLDNVFPTGVDEGEVLVCWNGGRPTGSDLHVAMTGTVVGIDQNLGNCTHSVTVEDEDGIQNTVGFTVFAEDGSDLTPELDVTMGQQMALGYRYRMVWGDVSGFMLVDTVGMVAAVDEGTWGGAFEEGDVPDLTVRYGELIGKEATSCEPVEGYSVVFEADEDSEISPVGQGTVLYNGQELTAFAVAGWKWGEGDGCDVSDATDRLAWVVFR